MNGLKLVVVCGLPVSGKSTLAEVLSKELKFPIFSVDPIESAIIKSGIKKSFETGLAAYKAAETLADEQLKLGHNVIIDAVNSVEEGKNMWRELSKKHKTKLVIIECSCSDENLYKKRVESRIRNIHGLDEVTWADILERKKEYTDWKEPTLKLDTSKDLDENTSEATKYINSA